MAPFLVECIVQFGAQISDMSTGSVIHTYKIECREKSSLCTFLRRNTRQIREVRSRYPAFELGGTFRVDDAVDRPEGKQFSRRYTLNM